MEPAVLLDGEQRQICSLEGRHLPIGVMIAMYERSKNC